jgi:steroid delta-isomerase
MTDPKPPEHLPSSAASAEPVRQSPARRLARFYETLTPAALPGLDQLYAPDARFKDPFNEVAGTAAIRRIFAHMFATTEAPRFEVTDCIEQGEQAMLGWAFHFALRGRHARRCAVSRICASTPTAASCCTATTGMPPRSCTRSCR